MKFFKIISFIIFIVIALVVGGLIFFVTTFDANLYKKQIISLVNKQTGRELSIDGDLKLAVYPDIAIELEDSDNYSGKYFYVPETSMFAYLILKQQSCIDYLQMMLRLNQVPSHRLRSMFSQRLT